MLPDLCLRFLQLQGGHLRLYGLLALQEKRATLPGRHLEGLNPD